MNPIELFWGQMKNHIGKTILPENKIEQIIDIAQKFADNFAAAEAEKLVEHSYKQEIYRNMVEREDIPIQMEFDFVEEEMGEELDFSEDESSLED